MPRLHYVSLSGELDVAIDDSESTLSSPGFASLPVVANGDSMVLTLDPFGVDGAPEHVLVTGHTSAATTIDVSRGVERAESGIEHGGIAGRAHAEGTAWLHGPVPSDLTILNRYVGTGSTDTLNLEAVTLWMVNENLTAINPAPHIPRATLVALQGATGGEWQSNTGVTISWEAGAPPTLSTTEGNYDVIELTRVDLEGTVWLGRHVVVDVDFAPI